MAFDDWVEQDKVPRNQQRSGTATHEAWLDSHNRKEESDGAEGQGTLGELEHYRNEGVEGHMDSAADQNMQDSAGIQGEGPDIRVAGVYIDHPFAVDGQVVGNGDYGCQE